MAKVVTVVQARFSSTRLPGKIFLPVLGEALLVRMLERVCAARLVGDVVVATTTAQADDETERLCRAHGIDCYRGHGTDLLDRHYQCALARKADVVLKIPSDCPLIDPAVIDRVIGRFLEGGLDFVSNLHPASYPDGQDVEVMTFAALEKAWREATRDFEREHTTPYLWENPELFRLANVTWDTGQDFSMSHRITIDYPEDYEAIRRIFAELYPANALFSLADIVHLLERKPEIAGINARYAGVNWYRHHLDALKTIRPDQTKSI